MTKIHSLYNRPLDITQDDVIHISNMITIKAWQESIAEQIAQLPDSGRGIEKKRAVLETFQKALRDKVSVYHIVHNIELKEQGIYKPILHFSTIFQQVAKEMLDVVTYQQIMDKIGDEAANEDGLTIDEKFTEDFDIEL